MSPGASIERSEAVAAHLAACFDGLYEGLGELAPTLTRDASVVTCYELARQFGECRHRFDELGPHRQDAPVVRERVPEIARCLAAAAAADDTGDLVIYALVGVIGPRLLISLRDAAAYGTEVADGPLRRRAQESAGVLVAVLHRLGVTARAGAAERAAEWGDTARALEEPLERAGYGESFTLGPAA